MHPIGLQLERKGDELVVSAARTAPAPKLFGALFAGFAAWWLTGWSEHDAGSKLIYAAGFLLASSFVVFGVSLMLPRSVTTTFDLGSQRVRRSETVFNRWNVRSRTYEFAEIASLGVHWSKDDDSDLNPIMSLKSGGGVALAPIWSLARTEEGFAACSKSIDAICAATGLPKCNDLK